ncbi:MAG: hypothetical protein ABIK83_13050 [Candidatus Zixiibacteriota bacterium]
MNKALVLLSCMVVLVSWACTKGSSGGSFFSNPDDSLNSLPSVNQTGTCVDTPEELDLCTWVASVDAVAYGKVAAVDIATKVIVEPTNEGVAEIAKCDGLLYPGLKITLSPVLTLSGEKFENSVEVYIGSQPAKRLDPRPVVDPSTEELMWLGEKGDGFNVGQLVGFGLYYVEEKNVLSVLDDHFFTETSEDGVVFEQVNADCLEHPPVFKSAEIEQFMSMISECSLEVTSSVAKRRSGKDIAGDYLEWSMASVCHES